MSDLTQSGAHTAATFFVDYSLSPTCDNPDAYMVEVCLRCNHCGRFNAPAPESKEGKS